MSDGLSANALIDRSTRFFPHAAQPIPLHGALEVRDFSGLKLAFAGAVPVVAPDRHMLFFAAKRAIDIALALSGFILLWPLLVLAAIAIKTTSAGPVFFTQERLGLDGKPFRIVKFRTIHRHCCDNSGVDQPRPGDGRVTTLGALLRKTSIDELPQLINILRGDMAFVGPRPHVRDMLAGGQRYEALVPYYRMRHCIKPGLTGWAQVHGLRGPTHSAALARLRVDHDLAYAANRSIGLDLRIIWLTLWRQVLASDGE